VPLQKPKPCPKRIRFGRNFAKLRENAGLTQEKVAEKTGISARYVQSIEAGEYWPSLPLLTKLRGAVGGSWEELLRGC
jgi:transcriptional regulator with XRE-family HTH domain